MDQNDKKWYNPENRHKQNAGGSRKNSNSKDIMDAAHTLAYMLSEQYIGDKTRETEENIVDVPMSSMNTTTVKECNYAQSNQFSALKQSTSNSNCSGSPSTARTFSYECPSSPSSSYSSSSSSSSSSSFRSSIPNHRQELSDKCRNNECKAADAKKKSTHAAKKGSVSTCNNIKSLASSSSCTSPLTKRRTDRRKLISRRYNTNKSSSTSSLGYLKKRGGAREPKSQIRRLRIEHAKNVHDIMAWSESPHLSKGHILHPEVGYLIHPSYFENRLGITLCPYGPPSKCHHRPQCRDVRLLMAARAYMENKEDLSYRDVEAVWGVSRSTVQRQTTYLADLPQKKREGMYQSIGWSYQPTAKKCLK